MRYECPSCSRVFYLDTKVVSPCPACGTMLQVSEEEEGGEAPAGAEAAATAEPSTGGSWLMGDMPDGPLAGVAAAPPAAAPPAAAPTAVAPPAAPPPSTAMPSPASWLTGAEEGAAEDSEEPEAATESTFAAAPTAVAAPPTRTSLPTVMMPAQQAPSGMKLLLVTAAAIFVALAVAVVVILFLPKKGILVDDTGAAGAPDTGEAAEIARLEIEVKNLRKEAAEYKGERDTIRSERDAADAELAKARAQADSMKAGFERRGEAAGKTLAALALLERLVDLAEALSLTAEALKVEPNFVEAHRLKGRILAASGRAEEALGAFESADEAARAGGLAGDVEALVLAGETALTDLGDRAKALAYYGRALDLEPDSALGLVAEARALMLDGELTAAVVKAAAAQRKAPSLALAPLVRGEIALEESMLKGRSEAQREGFRKKADDFLTRALRLDPNSVRACVARGNLLIREAGLASAESGFGLLRLGLQSQAESLLTRAYDLSPKLPEVHIALAQLRLGEGALHDAAVAKIRAKEAVRLTEGKDAFALATLAAAQAASGDPAGAAETMNKAVDLEPKNTGYREVLERYKMETKSLRR